MRALAITVLSLLGAAFAVVFVWLVLDDPPEEEE